MSDRPNEYERQLLAQLDLQGGVTSRMVASAMHYRELGPRIASAWARVDLDKVCAKGWAKRMDDQRPICWLLTEAGAEVLKQ